MRTCGWCGASVKGKRANAKYCSKSCRNMDSRARRQLPAVLREAERWVQWRPVKRGARWTKLPVTPSGSVASSTDPGTWSRFEDCAGDRKGFVLGAGFGCVDLDHVIVNGVLVSEAAELLGLAPATFVEVSPSGDGLHVWGRLPESRGRRFVKNGVSVEIYSGARYMTVTGRRWGTCPSRLSDLTDFVDVLMS